MIKVSVIVPVLNGISYINECMDSLISQTLKEMEILVIDAGSTDGTLEILEEYVQKDSRVRLLHSDQKSMGHQTNMGIQAASGEYIGFCEADDYLGPGMLEYLYQTAKSKDLDFVKSNFDMFVTSSEGRIFLNYSILPPEKRALYGNVIHPKDHPDLLHRDVNMWNGIYKRRWILENKIRLNETPKAAFQDVGFILQTFLLADRGMYVHEDANKYRRDNISSSVYDQQSLLFVVQEFAFFMGILQERQIAKKRTLAVILKRFLGLFCGFYKRLPEWSLVSEETKEAVERFKGLLVKFYSWLDYGDLLYEGLDTSIELRMLLENNPLLDAYERQLERIRRKSLNDFYAYVKKYEKAVIFGAGERGMSCLGLLQRNQYQGVIGFCDNNSSLWGSRRMGLEILCPDKAEKEGVLFIVAHGDDGRWKQIYDQLISMGADAKQICRAADVIPHHALELRLGEE